MDRRKETNRINIDVFVLSLGFSDAVTHFVAIVVNAFNIAIQRVTLELIFMRRSLETPL